MSLDGADRARPSDIAGDAELFPFLIAGLESALGHFLRLRVGNLVVGHHDAAAMPVILGVEEIHGVEGGAGTGEEVNDEGVGFVSNEEANSVIDRVKGFRKGKWACDKYAF